MLESVELTGTLQSVAFWAALLAPALYLLTRQKWHLTAVFVLIFGSIAAAAYAVHAPLSLVVGGAVLLLLLSACRRPGHALLVAVALVGSLGIINTQFQMVPTVGAITNRVEKVPYDKLDSVVPGKSVRTSVVLGRGRPAEVYLPPAYFQGATLPVLVLMHGNPGAPAMWMEEGQAPQIFDEYQDAHGGIAPIVVSVDATGSFTGNPLCVGWAHDYISDELPQAIKQFFRVDEEQSHWVLGGLSYGGTCALQIATTATDSYGGYIDMSGQREPLAGTKQQTVDKYFDGDADAYAANNPIELMGEPGSYPGVKVRFVVGKQDKDYRTGMEELYRAARRAGMDATLTELPGGHDYRVWREGLIRNIDFITRIGGINHD
ncbi:alpha/beta hydrolase [Corynebacterium pyruviciproducens]|uniref:Alpha/beta hydrolase-fold protein n=1 Tax=Corynebacterium pyruviciproducens TaxID=598660 RepID=A0AAF1BWI8_9CORY|nr:alpha/beta hydrolase-fold protein [Corynebacterium pyruviciproducens]WOT02482.1 alpha/beta hydrolase-fold protein [Corynebacterium pyruviciproducens]